MLGMLLIRGNQNWAAGPTMHLPRCVTLAKWFTLQTASASWHDENCRRENLSPYYWAFFQVQRPSLASLHVPFALPLGKDFWLVNLERITLYTELQGASMATKVMENKGLLCSPMPSVLHGRFGPAQRCHDWWIRLKAMSSNMASTINQGDTYPSVSLTYFLTSLEAQWGRGSAP